MLSNFIKGNCESSYPFFLLFKEEKIAFITGATKSTAGSKKSLLYYFSNRTQWRTLARK
jgi:hypothetical protein